ncbi:hypothetical protein PoB_000692900 [Plakobranchus ocellatus]|uniref:Uncharacterized protein n=1 Tax=Plakobranchus ocellatus TaxID=259542 RepID=A0AAV3YEC5_9GAST|nr:hypothetical protein PoB_000692900 [Plakobranchus ocellatus]
MQVATPILNPLEANSPHCPRSWYYYGGFCVKSAFDGPENAVAFVCTAIGGIGVRGLCVIKADAALRDLDLDIPTPSPMVIRPGEAEAEYATRVEEEEGTCPLGWAHYQSICVYKLSGEENWTCRSRGATQLRGMCLKHADPREARETSRMNNTGGLTQIKRICCCSHPNARGNSYGCF